MIFRNILLFVALSLFTLNLSAQNLIEVQFKDENSFPNFLNICGDPDDATVKITLDESLLQNNTSIDVELSMFPGISFEAFSPSATNPISLINFSNSNPIFSIDLSESTATEFEISYRLKADCIILDSLNQNNTLQLFNTWTFGYNNAEGPFTEIDTNDEYLDALAIPFFSFSENVLNDPVRVGDCKTREITITNSGLDGFVDSLNYEIIQGAGESFQSISLGGLALPYDIIGLPNGDTLITVKLRDTHFQTAINGDGDSSFDPDESIILSEVICVVDCYKPHSAQHNINWGCNGQMCSSTTYESFTPIGSGDPHATVAVDPFDTDVAVGYCQEGHSTMMISNTGFELDEGFGVMYDVSASIGLGTFLELQQSGITITELTIAGVVINNPLPLNNLDGHLQFQTDPDGPGGLEDYDNDGYFDDLRIDNSFSMSITYNYDCTMSTSIEDNCTNDISASINAIVYYTNSCDERLVRNQNDYIHPTNTSSAVQNFSDTDAFKEGGVFYITHKEERNIRNFAANCDDQQYFEVTVELPTGFTLEESETQLLKNINGSLPVLNTSLNGNLMTIQFDASANTFINGNYELILALRADCDADLGPSTFPMTMSFICPSCDCSHLWYCNDLNGPIIHGLSPPCTADQSNQCPSGIKTTRFDVDRITFGFTDNDYTIPFDQNIANKKAALSCDQVRMKISSEVGNQAVNDSIGFNINYANIDGTLDAGEIFTFIDGFITFELPTGNQIYNIQASDYNLIANNGHKTMNFDLSNALASLSLNLAPQTPIHFEGTFSLNPDGPYINKFRRVPDFRANSYATIDGVETLCDNYGESFMISKVSTIFSLPSNSKHPKGCETSQLDYRLNTINNGYATIFGNEKREAMSMDSITFNYDPSFLTSFDSIQLFASLPGHPIYGNDYYEIPTLQTNDNGVYTARFDTLGRFPSLDEVNSYAFVLRIQATPKCNSLTGSSDMDNSFDLSPTIYYKDRFYANEIGDGTCIDVIVEQKDASIFYSKQPEFSFQALSNPTFELTGDTATWTIKHCNTSFESSAPITWIAIENMDGQVNIESIENISDPNNITLVSLSNYGATGLNVFGYGDGLLEASSDNSAFDICNTYRIKATLNNCSPTSMFAKVGWNCSIYDDLWNPEDNPPCSEELIPLFVNPKSPFLDANVVNQPVIEEGICDTIIIDVLVKNTDLAAAFNVGADIYIPEFGTDFLPDDLSISYPPGQPFVSVQPNVTFNGIEQNGKKYTIDNFFLQEPLASNGLLPFNIIAPNEENQFVLRYKFITDCSFIGGSLSYYDIQGQKGCNEPTNIAAGETAPLFINSIDAELASYNINIADNSIINPMGQSILNIDVENNGTIISGVNDNLIISLPLGVEYIANSTVMLTPLSWVTTEPIIEVTSALTHLTWNLPAGINPSEIAQLQIGISTPNIDCDDSTFDLIGRVSTNSQVLCVVDNSTCMIESYISTNNPIFNVPIMSVDLSLDNSMLTSTCLDNGEENVTLNLTLTNHTGEVINQNVDFTIYFDANMNGIIDGTDTVVDESSALVNAENLETFNLGTTFNITQNQACHLLIGIDDQGLNTCDDIEFGLPTPIIDNLGSEISSCGSGTTIQSLDIEASCGTGYNYLWSAIAPAELTDISNISSPNVQINYTNNVTVTDTLRYILTTTRIGCNGSSNDTLTIIRNPGISFDLGPDITVLPNTDINIVPINLMGQGPFTYSWTPTDLFTDPSATEQNIQLETNQTISLTIENNLGCSFTNEINITVGDEIVATVTPTTASICMGEPIDFTASGGNTFQWSENLNNPSQGNLSSYISNITTFNDIGIFGTYLFTVVVSNDQFPNILDTATVQIMVNPTPFVGIQNSSTSLICVGEEVTLIGSGADSYQWFNANNVLLNNTSTLDIIPTNNQMIYLVGENEFSCNDTVDYTFLVEDELLFVGELLDLETCFNTTEEVSIGLNQNIGMVDIQPANFIQNIEVVDDILNFDVLYPGLETTFTVTMYNTSNNCSISDSFTFSECSVMCDYFNNQTTIQLEAESCDVFTQVCLSLDTTNISNYVVSELNNVPIASELVLCDDNSNYGLNLLPGTYDVIILDTLTSCADTAQIIIDCTIECDFFNNQQDINIIADNCDSLNLICLSLDTTSISNYTFTDINNNPFNNDLIICPDSTNYGLNLLPGEYQIIILDTLTSCADTASINISCPIKIPPLNCDTVYIHQDTIQYCVDDLSMPIIDVNILCTNDNGAQYNIDTLTGCVSYSSTQVGIDTSCISFTYQDGTMDTLFVCLTSVRTNPEWIYDTILVNESITYCLDTTELSGPVSTFENICPDLSGEYVIFDLDLDTTCLTYTGIDLETDTACIVICDMMAHCDTTYFSVTVIETMESPMAVDDYDTVRIGGTVTTNIKANDGLLGGIDTAYIITQPTYGEVILNLDCSATYNASEDFCEREDTYDYVICNDVGLCDTATVHIWLECEDIVIFTAVSPNGDGYNDVFYIAGLEDYPLNRVQVFNQWGNRVYVKDGYNNTWGGTWNNKLLPDGPYYYCLELNEDNRVYTGFMEIIR